jgi:hypothetical protein
MDGHAERVAWGWSADASHSRTVPSLELEATVVPSGLNASDVSMSS